MRVALTKHYVDVVTDAGDVAIAYWARIDAQGVSRNVGGIVRSCPSLSTRTFTLRGGCAPAWDGERLHWACAPLDLALEAERTLRPFSHRLLQNPEGALDWHCTAARARVRMTIGADVLDGIGYAEQLESTIAPWALPLSTLRWGRWSSSAHSVVWIVWEGAQPLHLVWIDGALTRGATVGASAVSVDDAPVLSLEAGRVITDASVGEQLTSLRPLRSLVDRVAGSRQTRWVSRGTWRDGSAGWAIHEVVHWN